MQIRVEPKGRDKMKVKRRQEEREHGKKAIETVNQTLFVIVIVYVSFLKAKIGRIRVEMLIAKTSFKRHCMHRPSDGETYFFRNRFDVRLISVSLVFVQVGTMGSSKMNLLYL